MDSSESSIKTWLKFFMDASIPAGVATEYAISFSDNRMRLDMLPDLTRDYLRDLNVTVLGDVIAIMKHAKSVIHQEYKARKIDSSGGVSPSPSPPPPAAPAVKKAAGSASGESPASRMVKRLVRKEPIAPTAAPAAGGRLKRTADSLPEGCPSGKKTVFDRLGGGSESQVSSTTPDSTTRFTITGLSGPALAQASTAAASPAGRQRVLFVPDAVRPSPPAVRRGGLSYRGVLKPGAGHTEGPARSVGAERKAPAGSVGTKRKAAPVTSTLASDREAAPVSARSRIGLPAASGGARVTARGAATSVGVKARLSRPTAARAAAGGVRARLGAGTGSVRSRLGTASR